MVESNDSQEHSMARYLRFLEEKHRVSPNGLDEIDLELNTEVFTPRDRNHVIVLGISCFYHDSAVCFTRNGVIEFAAEEERYSRRKHDSQFPALALAAGLRYLSLTAEDIDLVVFYENPVLKIRRMFTHNASDPEVLKQKLLPYMGERLCIRNSLKDLFGYTGPLAYSLHHHSHAASAFYPSPFEAALIMTLDGVGEYSTGEVFLGDREKITKRGQIGRYPHSIGLLYSSITAFLGFKPNNDEYKVMGLASYGKPAYVSQFDRLVSIDDASVLKLNMDYFLFDRNLHKAYHERMSELFGISPRQPGDPVLREHQDIAASLQTVTEHYMVGLVRRVGETYDAENLCLAGGVFLNSVANEKILGNTRFKKIFIQPAAGDSGGAVGAALIGYHRCFGQARTPVSRFSPFLGEQFGDSAIEDLLKNEFVAYERLSDSDLVQRVAESIYQNQVVGWFQGRMEFGPRALGNRSILANPCNPNMKDILNRKVKRRESFRPFAPAVLREDQQDYFDLDINSPYMLFVTGANQPRSHLIPSVIHVNNTARLQSVSERMNPLFYRLIAAFKTLSEVALVINTSFNIRGEPIVCTPRDAFNCFLNTNIDVLVLGNYLIKKTDV